MNFHFLNESKILGTPKCPKFGENIENSQNLETFDN